MKRREFITLLGVVAIAWPLAARAQQAAKLPMIGYLGSATSSAEGSRVAVFTRRLRELGWTENRTVAIEYRWAEGQSERRSLASSSGSRLMSSSPDQEPPLPWRPSKRQPPYRSSLCR